MKHMKYHSWSFCHLSQAFELPHFLEMIKYCDMNDRISNVLSYDVSAYGDTCMFGINWRRDMPF